MNQPCGCCATPAEARSTHPGNRPWLSAIDYRLGTFGTFREALLDGMSRTPALRALRSRVSDDYAVSAIESWSAVADVLTFYTERIANEAFLRTATQRDSVLRLVRVIDYQLAPGAAATTAVAFTLERGAAALIPARTRMQSVPGEGETAQKYETLEPLAARAALNQLRLFPAPASRPALATGSTRETAAPDAAAAKGVAALAPGKAVILYNTTAVEVLAVESVSETEDLLTATWRQPIVGSGFSAAASGTDPSTRAYALGRTFRAFGVDAPPVVVVSGQTDPNDATTGYIAQATTNLTFGAGPFDEMALDGRYPGLKPGAPLLVVVSTGGASPTTKTAFAKVSSVGEGPTSLEASYLEPVTGTTRTARAISGSVTKVQLSIPGTSVGTFVSGQDVRSITVYELLGDPLRFWPYEYAPAVATGTVFMPGRRAGWSSIELARTIDKGLYRTGDVLEMDALAIGRPAIALDARGGEPVPVTVGAVTIVGTDLEVSRTATDATTIVSLGLDGERGLRATVLVSAELAATIGLPSGPKECTVAIGPQPALTLSLDPSLLGGGALASVAVALQTAIRDARPGSATFAQTLVWASSSALFIAPGVPGDAVIFGPSEDDSATVAGLGLESSRVRYLDGVLSAPFAAAGTTVSGQVIVRLGIDPELERSITVANASPSTMATAMATAFGLTARLRGDDRVLLVPPLPLREPRSFLRLDLDLSAPLALDRSTAVLLGNVVPASHGETIRAEVVGDGDAAQSFQRFPLRKHPVTYVPASVPGGIASSLQLFVNGIRWTEVPTLYGTAPDDRVFTTRLADDGERTIQFGDGTTGERPPTGRQSLVATYRQGLGLAGRVRAGKLSTLLDRPTGVKSVTNPTAADGGADPEILARARQTAPGTVRTFGRAISLRDFEDTALLAGEVAKARAAWVWTGHRRVVHVTLAGQGGATFSPAGLARLAATLDTERDTNRRLLLGNYARVAILVTATLYVRPDHVAEEVVAAARATLLDSLAFEQRDFAETVDLSEIYATLQGVDGVLGVDVDRLDLKSPDPGFRTAHGIDPSRGQPQPRLWMLPARPSGSPDLVLPAELAWIEVPALDVVLRASGGITL
jgi:hypothetical protein